MSGRADGRRLLPWIAGYAGRRRAELAAAVVLTGLQSALDVAKPWPMVFLIDHVLRAEPMPSWLARLVEPLSGSSDRMGLVNLVVAATVVLFLLDWACVLGAKYVYVTLGQRVTYDVAADLLKRLQQLSLRFHTSRSVGDTVRRLTTDCASVAVVLRDALLPSLGAVATLVAMFLVMWRIEPLLTLIAVAVAPAMVLLLRLYAQPMLDRSYDEQNAEGRVYEVTERIFSAIPAVQVFGREELNKAMFKATADASIAASLRALNVNLQFKILIGLSTAVGTAAMLWLGAEAVLAGRMTVGGLVLFLSYLALLYAPLQALMYTGSTVQSAAGSALRVLDILSSEPEVRDRPGAAVLSRAKGAVAFEGVSFAYGEGRGTLSEISLEARPGERVALVGPTGAGKTTLVSLIPRFFDPTAGRVLLDGQDVRDVRLADLRAQVSLVLQEPFLFPLSVAENIAYGRPGASRAEIEAAARAARADEFIARLPDGYETVLGERGATLSGGERQRLSIARALIKDAPILILDEPTSALDAATEALILEALDVLMQGRTTFIIAHRLSTVRNADRILMLDEGRIVERGTHDELIAKGGLYALHASLQAEPA